MIFIPFCWRATGASPPSYHAWSVTTVARGTVVCSMCTTVTDNIRCNVIAASNPWFLLISIHRKTSNSPAECCSTVFLMASAVQYSTVQYSTVQYSTVQYSTVQYSTPPSMNKLTKAYLKKEECWPIECRRHASLCSVTVRLGRAD